MLGCAWLRDSGSLLDALFRASLHMGGEVTGPRGPTGAALVLPREPHFQQHEQRPCNAPAILIILFPDNRVIWGMERFFPCPVFLKRLFPMLIQKFSLGAKMKKINHRDGEVSHSLAVFVPSPHHLQQFFSFVHHINPTKSFPVSSQHNNSSMY